MTMISAGATARQFIAAIAGAAEMLENLPTVPERIPPESLPSLLKQCDSLWNESVAVGVEPIRTLHHFACTGGTLISKCIASMPNVQLLSEVDPLSTHAQLHKGTFLPTDLVGLLRASTRDVDESLLIDVFMQGLQAIRAGAIRQGLRLVLRDHAHSQFCHGDSIPERPTLREMVAKQFEVRSVVTVRHPVESYLSLADHGWLHFTPAGPQEYANRYQAFLDRYDGVSIIRYEDFVAKPKKVMQQVCNVLELPFNEEFEDVFFVHTISGDSGRSGNEIRPRPRKNVPDEWADQLLEGGSMATLCGRLGYDIRMNEYAAVRE